MSLKIPGETHKKLFPVLFARGHVHWRKCVALVTMSKYSIITIIDFYVNVIINWRICVNSSSFFQNDVPIWNSKIGSTKLLLFYQTHKCNYVICCSQFVFCIAQYVKIVIYCTDYSIVKRASFICIKNSSCS